MMSETWLCRFFRSGLSVCSVVFVKRPRDLDSYRPLPESSLGNIPGLLLPEILPPRDTQKVLDLTLEISNRMRFLP